MFTPSFSPLIMYVLTSLTSGTNPAAIFDLSTNKNNNNENTQLEKQTTGASRAVGDDWEGLEPHWVTEASLGTDVRSLLSFNREPSLRESKALMSSSQSQRGPGRRRSCVISVLPRIKIKRKEMRAVFPESARELDHCIQKEVLGLGGGWGEADGWNPGHRTFSSRAMDSWLQEPRITESSGNQHPVTLLRSERGSRREDLSINMLEQERRRWIVCVYQALTRTQQRRAADWHQRLQSFSSALWDEKEETHHEELCSSPSYLLSPCLPPLHLWPPSISQNNTHRIGQSTQCSRKVTAVTMVTGETEHTLTIIQRFGRSLCLCSLNWCWSRFALCQGTASGAHQDHKSEVSSGAEAAAPHPHDPASPSWTWSMKHHTCRFKPQQLICSGRAPGKYFNEP